MAEKKVIEIDIESNIGSLKSQLREAQAEVANLSDKFGATSKEAAEAAKRAAELKDKIGDAKALTDAFNPDAKFNALSASIGGVLNGFQAYEGALGLIGVESEQVQATLLKVQSAMALSQGIQSLLEAKDSFKQLGAVVKNNSIIQAAYAFIMGTTTTAVEANTIATETNTAVGEVAAVTTEVQAGANVALTATTNTASLALKAFRAALIATGIGAIVVLIGLLIANFDKVTQVIQKLSGYVIKAYDYFDNLGASIKILIGIFFPMIGVIYTAIKALEYFNVIDTKTERDQNARHKLELKRADEKIKKLEKQKKAKEEAYDKEDKALTRQIALLEAQGKSSDALVEKQIKNSIKRQKEQIKELNINQQILKQMAEMVGGFDSVAGSGLKQTYDENAKAIKDLNNSILDSENQLNINSANNAKERAQNAKDAADKAKEAADKLKEDSKKTAEELYKIEQDRLEKLNKEELDSLNTIDAAKKANQDMLLTEQDLAIQKENEAYQIKIDNAIKFGQDTEALEIEHLNNINNINLTAQEKQYTIDKEAKDKQIALDKETAAKKLEIEKALLEQKTAIQQQGLDTALQGIGIIKSIFEKSKGVQKAAVIAESAIGIAKMIIANKLANVGALATPQAIATSGASAVPVIAGNNISTAFGIAANVAATAKALSALGGGSAPSGSVGGGSGGGGSNFTPSFNVVGNSGINQLASLNQQPIKAYVTAGDVSSALSLERNTLQKSTF